MTRLSSAAVFAPILALVLFSGALLSNPISQRLEDWTGETDLKQQIVAVTSEISQRRLDTQDMAPIAHAAANPYGVNVFLEQEVEEWKLRLSMEMIRDSGARWIRLHVPWADVEWPAKGRFENSAGKDAWEKYDRIVALAEEFGVNILARLDDPPDWTRQDNSIHNSPPDRLEDFGDFVYEFVSRYRGRVMYYQIWNEPNVYPEWGNRPANATSYVELLRIAYTRSKQADPESVIVSAPLSPTLGTPDGLNESDLVYLQKMYDAGAASFFDVMAVNAYGLWTGPGDRRVEASRTNFSRPLLLREIMVRNGDAGKAVWATEMGWNALPEDFPGPATHGRVSLERQASYTVAAYRRAQEEWPWMGVIFYWHFRMVREDPDQVAYYYRMVDPDFTVQPVYDAFRHMTQQPAVLTFGYRPHDHWALHYQGRWTIQADPGAFPRTYAKATEAGSRLTFTFKGSWLKAMIPRTGQGGRAYVLIDGSNPSGLPEDEQGRAYVDTASLDRGQAGLVTLAGSLPDGEHEAEITVASPGFAVEAIVVEQEARDWWRVFGGAALLLTSVIVLVWAFIRQ